MPSPKRTTRASATSKKKPLGSPPVRARKPPKLHEEREERPTPANRLATRIAKHVDKVAANECFLDDIRELWSNGRPRTVGWSADLERLVGVVKDQAANRFRVLARLAVAADRTEDRSGWVVFWEVVGHLPQETRQPVRAALRTLVARAAAMNAEATGGRLRQAATALQTSDELQNNLAPKIALEVLDEVSAVISADVEAEVFDEEMRNALTAEGPRARTSDVQDPLIERVRSDVSSKAASRASERMQFAKSFIEACLRADAEMEHEVRERWHAALASRSTALMNRTAERKFVEVAVRYGLPVDVEAWWRLVNDVIDRGAPQGDDCGSTETTPSTFPGCGAADLVSLYCVEAELEKGDHSDDAPSEGDANESSRAAYAKHTWLGGTGHQTVWSPKGVRPYEPAGTPVRDGPDGTPTSHLRTRPVPPASADGPPVADHVSRRVGELFVFVGQGRWSPYYFAADCRALLELWPTSEKRRRSAPPGAWRIYRFEQALEDSDLKPYLAPAIAERFTIAEAKSRLATDTADDLG